MIHSRNERNPSKMMPLPYLPKAACAVQTWPISQFSQVLNTIKHRSGGAGQNFEAKTVSVLGHFSSRP
jgi:hypothetical protein